MIVEPNIAPLAKRLAEENNVNWRGLSGTGSDGRIIERDVLEYLAKVMAGDEDINPTSEPVPEGMEAWPEEDTKGFFESQVDASVNDSSANWASASDEDVLNQIEEEELSFNIDTVESEADDLLKQSGVFLNPEDDLLDTVEDDFSLKLGDDIFASETEESFSDDLKMDSIVDENITEDLTANQADVQEAIAEGDITEDVFLFDDDTNITEVDMVVEDLVQAEDDEITNLFSDNEEELVSEDMLIEQNLSMDSDEDNIELDASDLFASSVEEVDEDSASLFIDDEAEDLTLNPGLDSNVEELLATSQDLDETIDMQPEESLEKSVDNILSELSEESLEIEADILEEADLGLDTETLNLESDQGFLDDADISEMESLEAILEDFEDGLENEDIAVAEVTEDTLEPELNLDTEEDLNANDVTDTETIEEDMLEPGLIAAGVVAGSAAIASQKEAEAETTGIAADAEVIEEVVEIEADAPEEEILEIEADTPEEVVELEKTTKKEEVVSLPSPISLIAPQTQMSHGVLLRRQVDLNNLLEASDEVSKELVNTLANSVFLLKVAAKAAQESGLADASKLAFASFESDGMKIRAVDSAKTDSFTKISKILTDSDSVLDDLGNIDLIIADISTLDLDDAALNVAVPVMTLGRIDYSGDRAKSILSISGDVSIERGAKFIAIFSELIKSPIRLLV